MGFPFAAARGYAAISLVSCSRCASAHAQAVICAASSTTTRPAAPVRGTVMLVDPAHRRAPGPQPRPTPSVSSRCSPARGVYQIAAVHPGYTSVLSAPCVPERRAADDPDSDRRSGDPQHRSA